MTSVLDKSFAFEDCKDACVFLVDCSRELAIDAYRNFNELRLAGKMCDVEIEVEGIKFKAHKVILAVTVPYFMKMFASEMVEANSHSIHMSFIDAEIMGLILDFVYTGCVKFTSANMERLLKAVDYLQLSVLSSRVFELLTSQMTEQNVFSIRRLALLCNEHKTVREADTLIQYFFESVSKCEEFLQLDFQTLCQILGWDDLLVTSEENVFEAVIRWLEVDQPNRRIYAAQLLATVRMHFLRPVFIVDEVSSHPLLHSSMECRDLIDEAKNFHLVPERRSQFAISTRFKTTARVCTVHGRIYAMGGISDEQLHPPTAVEYFDPSAKKWNHTEAMFSQRTRFGVAVFYQKIYVVGGFDGLDRLDSVEEFDTRTSQWERLPPMFTRKSAICAVTLGEQIYVCGGYDGANALRSVESFDVGAKRWAFRPPMLSRRCAAATTVLNGQIYVIGGHNGSVIFNAVERFDPISQRWEEVAPMQHPRCRLAVTTFQNKIYASGGYFNNAFLSTAEVYDPETDQWSYIAPMKMARARLSLVTNGNLLYAIGGCDMEEDLSSVEVYCPTENRWASAAPMRAHKGAVCCVVVPFFPSLLNKLKRPVQEDSQSVRREWRRDATHTAEMAQRRE